MLLISENTLNTVLEHLECQNFLRRPTMVADILKIFLGPPHFKLDVGAHVLTSLGGISSQTYYRLYFLILCGRCYCLLFGRKRINVFKNFPYFL